MTALRRIFRHKSAPPGLFKTREFVRSSWSRRFLHNGIVQENDRVVLTRLRSNHSESTSLLTPPLALPNTSIDLRADRIFHHDIIGKRLRDVVTSKKGHAYRITEPTLGEYTNLVPRLVTPIYPQDAALIVSLLDLNPTQPGSKDDNGETFEIFEAGTGHGALTIHLARAIHAANPCAPEIPEKKAIPPEQDSVDTEDVKVRSQIEQKYEAWLQTRRAVIHTLDINQAYSHHARRVIKDYRNGMYFPNIDFHIGTIPDYISRRLEASESTPFLSHAFLDLPDCHHYMDILSKALKPGGSLLVFCPSITQINRCALDAKSQRIPLFLENVIELGAAVGVGGREWDVKPVRPRKWLKEASARKQAEKDDRAGTEEGIGDEGLTGAEEPVPVYDEDGGWELVCRPKVGQRVVGGGFVGVWKKMYMD